MKVPPDPLMPGEITGRMLRDFLNALLEMARKATIQTDPGSGLESKQMGDFTALWIRRRQTVYLRLAEYCGGGSYAWVEQVPIPVPPYFTDATGYGAVGGCEGSGTPGVASAPALALNPTDTPYPVDHIVPARHDPTTGKYIIMAGS